MILPSLFFFFIIVLLVLAFIQYAAGYRAIRAYKHGLAVVWGRHADLFPWECVARVWIAVSPSKVVAEHLFGLERLDGNRVIFPGLSNEDRRLSETVLRETRGPILRRAKEQLAGGGEADFGSVVMGADGIAVQGRWMPWNAIVGVKFTSKELQVTRNDGTQASCSIWEIANSHVLLDLIAQFRDKTAPGV